MNATTSAVPEGAGFLERLVAMLIDSVILAIVLAIPTGIVYFLFFPLLAWLVQIAITVGYALYFWTSSGSTPGKMAMKLKVVNAETGELIDSGTAVLRYVGYFVSAIPLYLGFIWILFDDKKEGWHDKIAKTRVIKTS